ncbi:MAG: DUF4175 family protein [Myxococcota bacterium]|nr:DUF4175 family protein [Myxococcota bacterium]
MKPAPFRPIFDRIAETRRRIITGICLSGLGRLVFWLLSFTMALLLVVDWTPTATWHRVFFYAGCIGGLIWIGIRHVWSPVLRTRPDDFIAHLWEEKTPHLSDGLIASVKFAQRWDGTFKGSRPMVEKLAKWVGEEIAAIDIRQIAPWTACRDVWLRVAGAAIIWLAVLGLAPDFIKSGLAHLLTPDKSNRHDGITVQDRTLVGDVTVSFIFPDYLKRSSKVIPNSTGNMVVPKGTRIDIEATTVEPQSGAFLMVDDREVPAQLSDARKLRASLVAERPADWRFGTIDARQQRALEATKRTIRLEPDLSPVVQLNTPETDQEMENIRDVPVVYSVRDDVEIGRVSIGIALAGDLENAIKIEQTGVQGNRFEGADDIDLSIIDAQAGDRLAIFVEAYDTNQVDGPQRGVSEVRFITIRSPSEKHLKLTDDLNKTIGMFLDRLADRLEFNVNTPSTQTYERWQTLHSETLLALDHLGKIIAQMVEDPLMPKEITNALTERMKKLRGAVDNEGQYLGQVPSDTTNPSAGKKTMAGIIDHTESLIIYIEAMVARLALENLSQLAQELRGAKDKLKALITAYKARPNEALKGRILRNIKRLKDRMADLQTKLSKLRQKMPKEFLNLEGFKQDDVGKGLSKTRSQLEEIERMLDEGRVDEALNEIDEMSKALDELTDSLDQDMQDLHDTANPQQQRAISELMDQARDLMKQQDDVRRDTQNLDEAQQAARKEMLKKELKSRLDDLKKEVLALRQDVDGLARHPWTSRSDEDLNTLNQRVQGLSDAVEEERLVGALERAELVKRPLSQLGYAARFQPKLSDAKSQVKRATKRDDTIIELLSDMLRQMKQQQNSPSQAASNEQLRQRQAGLEEAARRLKQSMGEKAKQIPGLSGEATQQLQQIREAMGRAGKELGRQQPGRARPGQREAVAQLRGLMKSLKNAAKPQQAQRGGERGRQRSREKVKIPGADDHRTPDAFRKDLLDAMKDKAPERYRDEVKRYYEALVE